MPAYRTQSGLILPSNVLHGLSASKPGAACHDTIAKCWLPVAVETGTVRAQTVIPRTLHTTRRKTNRAYSSKVRSWVMRPLTLSDPDIILGLRIDQHSTSMVASKPAIRHAKPADGRRFRDRAASLLPPGKLDFVIQLRGPHLRTWPSMTKRSSIAETAALSPKLPNLRPDGSRSSRCWPAHRGA